MTFSIPKEILSQHIAVLGKTGSGKTSTAKLAIEQIVAEGARVCVLDPIKSDWWGLTSSANGKHAGLPFHILGGPHGHVPLHSGAGKAIADIVATGALPLSIVDMADFEPGGQAKFFVDFAPALLRKMRGVVYLVIEEAHLFAPKERSGIGAENLSIHWAKTMATAGRSKGVRLVLVTQRTQALHNALLGSCDTLIAHRLTAPADQGPVVKWLKANTSKDVLEQVSGSLSSLKTGEGWICSGEAKVFERVSFPRIHTYDNTATPTGDGDVREVKTAAVDQEKLRAIIGDAVEKAKADDPRELRKKISDLEKQLAQAPAQVSAKSESIRQADRPVLTAVDRQLLESLDGRFSDTMDALAERADVILNSIAQRAKAEIDQACGRWVAEAEKRRSDFIGRLQATRIQGVFDKVRSLKSEAQSSHPAGTRAVPPGRSSAATRPTEPRAPRVSDGSGVAGDPSIRGGKFRQMLIALAQAGRPLSDTQVAARAVMALSGTFDKYLSQQKTNGWVEGSRQALAITEAGLAALGSFDPLPTGVDLQAHWLGELGAGKKAEMLRTLIGAYPMALSDEALSHGAAMALSGTFDKYLSQLRRLQLVEGPRHALRASEELFL